MKAEEALKIATEYTPQAAIDQLKEGVLALVKEAAAKGRRSIPFHDAMLAPPRPRMPFGMMHPMFGMHPAAFDAMQQLEIREDARDQICSHFRKYRKELAAVLLVELGYVLIGDNLAWPSQEELDTFHKWQEAEQEQKRLYEEAQAYFNRTSDARRAVQKVEYAIRDLEAERKKTKNKFSSRISEIEKEIAARKLELEPLKEHYVKLAEEESEFEKKKEEHRTIMKQLRGSLEKSLDLSLSY